MALDLLPKAAPLAKEIALGHTPHQLGIKISFRIINSILFLPYLC